MNCRHHTDFSVSFNELMSTACSLKTECEEAVDNVAIQMESRRNAIHANDLFTARDHKIGHSEQVSEIKLWKNSFDRKFLTSPKNVLANSAQIFQARFSRNRMRM
jgi:hypothetical protein